MSFEVLLNAVQMFLSFEVSATIATVAGSGLTPLAEITCPKNRSSSRKDSHFDPSLCRHLELCQLLLNAVQTFDLVAG